MAVYLGAYDDEEAAARAYDLAALKYWGPGTLINFPVKVDVTEGSDKLAEAPWKLLALDNMGFVAHIVSLWVQLCYKYQLLVFLPDLIPWGVSYPTYLCIQANLVAAQFVTEIGWNEFAISMFSLGMTHYLILFVMLYQRLTGAFLVSSKMLFFLFVPFYFSACAEYAHEVKSLMASGLMLLIYVLQQGWIVDYASRMLTVKKQPVVTEQKLDPHYQMQKGFNVKIELLAAVLSPMLDQRILHERIPTKEALWHRGVITDPHQ
ncbi:hypothetical protein TSUD_61880 [Trifolium subterraneum]|uniref:AP2/ERF domain-containing protein n=1 Tax=Trifolium subterraneum TaxID=3900 RepID=A0A2Z6N326_TRISU|nr:hypothetical protein TSUD_61880 [Trifolium subterraneum]